jgi:hypothetical protein
VARIEVPDPFDETVYLFCIGEEYEKRMRLYKEQHGRGCGCSHCRVAAVIDHQDCEDRVDWWAEQGRWGPKAHPVTH